MPANWFEISFKFEEFRVPLFAWVARVIADVNSLTTLPSAESPTCNLPSVVAAVWVKVSSWAICAARTTLSAAAPGLSESDVTCDPLASSAESPCSVAETWSSELTRLGTYNGSTRISILLHFRH